MDEVGEDALAITQERYDELMEAYLLNKKSRGAALEEFRLWCVANKGVDTVEEGLRACTPDELLQAVYTIHPARLWVEAIGVCWGAARRLDRRKEQTDSVRQALQSLEHVMPEGS